jgi:hypothetical protein
MTDAAKQADDIAELKRKLVMLEEAVIPPAIPSEQDAAEYRNQIHQLREAQMSHAA